MSVTHLEDFVQMMVKSSGDSLTEAVDGPGWRETLHRLVARCYRKNKPKNGGGEHLLVDQVAVELANTVVSEYSPVVSLYDVLKFKSNEEEAHKPVQQDEFLHYFDLSLNNNSGNKMLFKNIEPYSTHHPRNLINTPQVPFSSDLGIKLIKERPEIPQEIHERKLERLERYLKNIPSPEDVQYEVAYNKKLDLEYCHFYTFPTRNFHDKNKLTPKARHLLKKYCKPCSVNLLRLDSKKLSNYIQRNLEKENQKDQKENIQLLKNKGIYLESRVVLTDNFNHSLKTFQTNKPLSKLDNETRKTRPRNFGKTLTPRNENAINMNNDVQELKNACVILQPVNKIIKFKKNISKIVAGRVTKRNSPHKRRFSPRLNINKRIM